MYEEVYCLKGKTTTELAKIYDAVEVTRRKIRYCRLLDLKMYPRLQSVIFPSATLAISSLDNGQYSIEAITG